MDITTYIANIEKDIANHILFNKILDSLSKFEGKEVSNRIVSHLEKEFPEFRIFEFWDYSFFRIRLSNSEYDLKLNLASEKDKVYSRNRVYYDLEPSFGIGAEKRKRKYENSNSDQILELQSNVMKYEQMKKELETLRVSILETSRDTFGATFQI
jgi:hypothetical protein